MWGSLRLAPITPLDGLAVAGHLVVITPTESLAVTGCLVYSTRYSGTPLYNGHHWEPTFVPFRPNSGASGIFPVGVVCVIGLLSTTWLRFQSFAVRWQGRLNRG